MEKIPSGTHLQKTNVRELKISSQERGYGLQSKKVPEIRLSGVWLEKLGFEPCQRIKVFASEKMLIIKLDE